MTDIDEDREVSIDEMLDYLRAEGGRTPGSRYGYDAEDCAPWAVAMQLIYWDANGDGGAPLSDSLHHWMGLVVNDHSDVLDLVVDYRHVLVGGPLSYVLDDAEDLYREGLVDEINNGATLDQLVVLRERLNQLREDDGSA